MKHLTLLLLLPLLAAPSLPDRSPDAASHMLARKADTERVERIMGVLSIEEKAAQMVMAYPQRDKTGKVIVGGVIFVGSMATDPVKAKAHVKQINSRALIQPFFAVDSEGGSLNRFGRHPNMSDFPSAKALGKLPDDEVEEWGRKVGKAMLAVGLDVSLAPVLDVAGSGHMHDRSRAFGSDAKVVSSKGSAFARGLLDVGVAPIAKHFPGYGDLASDSDHEVAKADWPRGKVDDGIAVFKTSSPFLAGVVMSNVAYTSVSSKPAILDAELVGAAHDQGLLVITDDLAIDALETFAGSEEAVFKQAFLAGNDVLLTTAPPDWDKGLDYVGILTKMAKEDPAHRKRIEDACRRILTLKDRMGLLEGL